MNKVLDYIIGGRNFEKKDYGKRGEIIYPASNGTNGWFCTPKWEIITNVDKKGKIISKIIIWDYSVVKTLEVLRELKKRVDQDEN